MVAYAEVKAELGIGNDIYTFLCRYLPSAHRLAHKIMAIGASSRGVYEEVALWSLANLVRVVNHFRPDVIICAYFLHSFVLEKWRRESGKAFKLWTVVADPRTISPAQFVAGADLHLIYDDYGRNLGIKFGIPAEKTMVSGWWVREEMQQSKFKNQISKIKGKLGFSDERPIIFVGGGSLGTNSLTKILPALMLLKKKAGLIFNCGTDRLMFNLVNEYVRIFKKLKRGDLVQVRNFGWVENMGEMLAAADIVFGKAGPNFLFDCVAAEKPFVAMTHVGGQEDGNLNLIREKGLGWVKEKNGEIGEFLLRYLEDPKKYQEKFRRTIRREAAKNAKSLEKVYKRLKSNLQKGEL